MWLCIIRDPLCPSMCLLHLGGDFLTCLGEYLKAVANIEKGEMKVKNPGAS